MNTQNSTNTALQIFHNDEFGDLETIQINGKIYFPATACAGILDYSNPRDAILRHCKGS
jgi:prophage antirepressor-like protein